MLALAISGALAASPAADPAAEALSAFDTFCMGSDFRTRAVRPKAEARGWSAYHDPQMRSDSASQYFFGAKPAAGEGDPDHRVGVELADLVEDQHGVPTVSFLCTVTLSPRHAAELKAGLESRFGTPTTAAGILAGWDYWSDGLKRLMVEEGDRGIETLPSGQLRLTINQGKLATGLELMSVWYTSDSRYSSVHVSRIRKENP